jgi:hypothetical protein
VDAAKIDRSEKMRSLKTLHCIALSIEKNCDPFADTDKIIAFERENSYKYGGMTVKGPAKPRSHEPAVQQLSLFP